MIGVLIVTHGNLAAELLAAGQRIAGELPNFRALSLDWSDGLDAAKEKVRRAIEDVDQGAGVLVLTDMFGDTPSNAVLACCEPGRVEMVSGANLPMIVRLGCTRQAGGSLAEVARWLEVKARRSIQRAGSVARGPLPGRKPNDG